MWKIKYLFLLAPAARSFPNTLVKKSLKNGPKCSELVRILVKIIYSLCGEILKTLGTFWKQETAKVWTTWS